MKKHILNLVLCLILVLSFSVSAAAQSLNTANVKVGDGTVEIGMEEDTVLVSLDESGKTAQIAIPVPSDYDAASAYYVEKDGSLVVTAAPVVKDGFMRFPVPGAGMYVIKQGTPPAPRTLDELLSNPSQNGEINALPVEILKENHEINGNVVIVADGAIKGEGSAKTLTVGENSTLAVENLNGTVKVELEAGDAISFDTNGNAIISAAENKKGNVPVGYGSFCLSGVNSQDTPYTTTYFLVRAKEAGKAQDEFVTVKADGKVEFSGVFAPAVTYEGQQRAMHPIYDISIDGYDSTYQQGQSRNMVARCNGLYEHLVSIVITSQNFPEKRELANMAANRFASGVKVEKGSTVLTMENSYLSTLPAGKHSLVYTYDDGQTVYKELEVTQKVSTAVADTTNPKTGDPMMGILLILMGSLAGLAAVSTGKRKIR